MTCAVHSDDHPTSPEVRLSHEDCISLRLVSVLFRKSLICKKTLILKKRKDEICSSESRINIISYAQ